MKKTLPFLLILIIGLGAACQKEPAPGPAQTASPTASPPVLISPSPTPPPVNDFTAADALLLSMSEGGYYHLFLYTPQNNQFTRLTNGAWNDVAPALSPDGRWLAFASDRNNYWDLYLLDLTSGALRPLTNTPNYENAPSWSPDGQWLVYEAYAGNNLDLFILNTQDLSQPPIRLTKHPATDFAPAWSPDGRHIAFVSTRSGQSDIWMANLDIPNEGRFINLTQSAAIREDHPIWSPDGSQLAWNGMYYGSGLHQIFLQDTATLRAAARRFSSGDLPIWSPEGSRLAVFLEYPNQHYFSAWTLSHRLVLPPMPLRGSIRGALWLSAADWMQDLPISFRQAAQITPTPVWSLVITPPAETSQRWHLVTLEDNDAPYPALSDLVDEAFTALRQRTQGEVGWDALANLENAFVPLSNHLDPGLQTDWLYTGRAFALNRLLEQANWLTAVREDYNQQTWWRVYLRARAQDGSQGEPLHHLPWDFQARYTLDPGAYDAGGQLMSPPPSGYWFDFTALAADYGWQRLPALANWQTYYAGARFTEFVHTEGQTWEEAMLEIYPDLILTTPTPVIPPTWTPTATPRYFKTPTPSLTPSPQPTYTPVP